MSFSVFFSVLGVACFWLGWYIPDAARWAWNRIYQSRPVVPTSTDYIAILRDFETGCCVDISIGIDAAWDLNMLALLYRGCGIRFAETWTWQRHEDGEVWRPL